MSEADFDPLCDPAHPRTVSFEEITSAAYRISSGIVKTPCVPSHMDSLTGCQMYLKCEFLQYTGSFKERGVRNAMLRLTPELKQKGVISASLGNHSLSMGYHGKMLKVPTTVVTAKVTSKNKINKCKAFGANVVVEGVNLSEAKHHALALAKEKKFTYISGYDNPDVIAGAGTMGLEIIEQVPGVQAVLVPCGGGALLAGVLVAIKHLRPNVLVYGVETEKSASMTTSLKAGKPTPYKISSTLADALAIEFIGVNAFYNIKPLIDKMVVVTEDWVSRAILRIAELEKYIVEGAGAVTTAAILAGLVPELKGKKVVCICSGGNIDTSVLSASFERGLVNECRHIKFKVDISNFPDSLAGLCRKLGNLNVSIIAISMEHAWIKGTIFNIRVKMICETMGLEHVHELRQLLNKDYPDHYFPRDQCDEGPNEPKIKQVEQSKK